MKSVPKNQIVSYSHPLEKKSTSKFILCTVATCIVSYNIRLVFNSMRSYESVFNSHLNVLKKSAGYSTVPWASLCFKKWK